MDRRTRRTSIYLALGIVVLVSLWMLSGLGSEPAPQAAATTSAAAESAAESAAVPAVRSMRSVAMDITREVVASGRTQANRFLELKAETEGGVVGIDVERGQRVRKGQTLLSLDLRDRELRLREAAARVKQRETELQALADLRGQQFSTEIQIAEAEAALASARAAHAAMELEISQLTLQAPFASIVQERPVEIGDLVRVGDPVATLVDLDPLIVVGEVNERDIASIQAGGAGTARILDGEVLEGSVRYISAVADAATRTFAVELAIPNPEQRWQAGLTAELRLYADTVRVHALSSALLSLADDGTVGVKVVEDGRVRFYPVVIVGSAQDGMYVSGLPESVEVITVGQGYVTEGQRVSVAAQ